MRTSLLFLLALSYSGILLGQTQDHKSIKVETLAPNFRANGAVSVDQDGHVNISEYGVFINTGGNGNSIFKLDASGKILDTISNLSGPMGTVTDANNNLYVNNDNNMTRGQILRISPEGDRKVFATLPGWPSGMAMDTQGTLYVTNYNAPRIDMIDAHGTVSTFAEDPRLSGCVGIDFTSKGELVVSNFYTATIFLINSKGVIKELVTLKDIVVQGWGIGYLTVIDDTIYATGIAVSKLFKVSLDGSYEIFTGNGKAESVNGILQSASLNYPNGISSDKKNKILYISEYGPGGGIRKIQL
ncbi:hypothetical protein [Spongiimicrobium salis]|uniref:hypothetical protein n=1 Tax=Spongiimicrobium salis TaxID=1667022 RepID=UPI00374CA0B5